MDQEKRAPTVPQTRLLASSIIIVFIASFFDPLSFIYITPRGVMGASKTPTLGLAKAFTSERKNKCGLMLLLKYVRSS